MRNNTPAEEQEIIYLKKTPYSMDKLIEMEKEHEFILRIKI